MADANRRVTSRARGADICTETTDKPTAGAVCDTSTTTGVYRPEIPGAYVLEKPEVTALAPTNPTHQRVPLLGSALTLSLIHI